MNFLLILAGLALLVGLAGRAGWLAGRSPTNLGVRDGRLTPPSRTPNSVSSQARLWTDHPRRERAHIEPFALHGSGPATIERLRAIVGAMNGATIVETRGDYLYARYRSPGLRFVDDAEFWFDPQTQVIHVRSASRVGRRDFHVNRLRLEAIRTRLAAA